MRGQWRVCATGSADRTNKKTFVNYEKIKPYSKKIKNRIKCMLSPDGDGQLIRKINKYNKQICLEP